MQLPIFLTALFGQEYLTHGRPTTQKVLDVSYGQIVVDTNCQYQCQCPLHQTWNEVEEKCVDNSDTSDIVYDYDPNDVDKDNCNVNEYFSEEEQRCVPTNRDEDEVDTSQDKPIGYPSCEAHEVWSDNQKSCVPIKSGASVARNSLAILVFTIGSILL